MAKTTVSRAAARVAKRNGGESRLGKSAATSRSRYKKAAKGRAGASGRTRIAGGAPRKKN